MQPSSTPEISASDSLVFLWAVRILHFGWLINNRNLFLVVLEAGKSKIKVPADLISGEGFLPVLQTATCLLCPHKEEREH